MQAGVERMYIAEGENDDDNTALTPVDAAWVSGDALRVFDGNLTCCDRLHERCTNCDREKLVTPILGLCTHQAQQRGTAALATG